MPLRLDNARASPTCPQQEQQKNQPVEPRFKIDHAASPMPETRQPERLAPRATSNRNGGRDHLGILGEIKSVHPGEIIGISTQALFGRKAAHPFKKPVLLFRVRESIHVEDGLPPWALGSIAFKRGTPQDATHLVLVLPEIIETAPSQRKRTEPGPWPEERGALARRSAGNVDRIGAHRVSCRSRREPKLMRATLRSQAKEKDPQPRSQALAPGTAPRTSNSPWIATLRETTNFSWELSSKLVSRTRTSC